VAKTKLLGAIPIRQWRFSDPSFRLFDTIPA